MGVDIISVELPLPTFLQSPGNIVIGSIIIVIIVINSIIIVITSIILVIVSIIIYIIDARVSAIANSFLAFVIIILALSSFFQNLQFHLFNNRHIFNKKNLLII